jgi:hypothetical protein
VRFCVTFGCKSDEKTVIDCLWTGFPLEFMLNLIQYEEERRCSLDPETSSG